MGASMSQYSTCLANNLCGGSSRKLIAGWWYSILGVSLIIALLAFWTVSTRTRAEGFASFWSAFMVLCLCIGGTMIMRKFHNSIAVGFFMGCVVAMSQLFFLLFLIYVGYASDRRSEGLPGQEEMLNSLFCLAQSMLLASFAAMLGAHRSQILDRNQGRGGGGGGDDDIAANLSGEFSADSAGERSAGYNSPTFM